MKNVPLEKVQHIKLFFICDIKSFYLKQNMTNLHKFVEPNAAANKRILYKRFSKKI